MEFVQFHPTGMVWPPGVRGLLVTEAVRGEGGILRNSEGSRFMWDYLPDERRREYAETDQEARRWVEALTAGEKTDARQPPELSTRDNISRAIYTEVREGRGSPHGGVFLDISYLPAEQVRRKLPSMYEQFKELADVDITAGAMEVGPTVHYVMGGVRVDADTAATTKHGLFAAGEVAGGMHGANRLGGNSLTDLLVFGRRAGMGAADLVTADRNAPYVNPVQVRAAVDELAAPFERPQGENPYRLQSDLQETMQDLVGIFRTESDLTEAVDRISSMKSRWPRLKVYGSPAFHPGWNLVFEMRNLLACSESVARSALQRQESRGGHARVDYPDPDPRWESLNSVSIREGEGMRVTTAPKPRMPRDLAALIKRGGKG
jgi:succinate dehydrogenase / fumarate reductase flavoprotein subunit